MITKGKIIVIAIIVAIPLLLVFYFFEQRVRWERQEAARITMWHDVIQIGLDDRYTPMEYVRPYGITPLNFDMALGMEIATRLGFRARFITLPWDRVFDEFDTGRFDIILSSVTITPQRQAAYNFSIPYLANPLVMVTRKDSPISVQSPHEAAGLTIAFQEGTTADYFIQRLASSPRPHAQIAQSFAELEQGQVDAVLTDLLVARHFILPADSPFAIAWKSPTPDFFGITLQKNNDRLTEAINRVLEEMFNDGTMLRLSIGSLGLDFVTQAR